MPNIDPRPLWTIFERTAARWPERPAIVFAERVITYAELAKDVRHCSDRLNGMGVAAGTVIAACLENGIEFVTLFLSVAELDATLVPIDDRLPTAEIRDILADCIPDMCVFRRCHEDVASEVFARLVKGNANASAPASVFVEDIMASHAVSPAAPAGGFPAPARRSAGFLIQYTSGSTGAPKGLVHSQSSLANTAAGWNQTVSLSSNDKLLCILTLAHAHATDIHLLPALAAGAALHLIDLRRITPRRVLTYIAVLGISVFSALPYTYELMLTLPDSFAPDLSRLRLCFCGSAPLSATLGERFARRFGVRLSNLYGMSELGPTHTNLFDVGDVDFASVGRPIRGIRAKVVDSDGGEVRTGEVGEILMSSATFALGYFNRPDLSAEVFGQDGWIRSQDLGYVDSHGRYFIVGRKSQFMNVGGNKVYPTEVEGAILELPGVRHAAVIGVDDPVFTERIVAFVAAEAGLTREAIAGHCRSRLADYKVPCEIVMCPDLPRNGIGKIMKPRLKEWYDQRSGPISNGEPAIDTAATPLRTS
jgi:acyl-CoA synthetase (AMP-forming)/AMP-acid ligase II